MIQQSSNPYDGTTMPNNMIMITQHRRTKKNTQIFSFPVRTNNTEIFIKTQMANSCKFNYDSLQIYLLNSK